MTKRVPEVKEMKKLKKKVAKFRKYIMQESGCYHVQCIQNKFKEIFGDEGL